MFRLATCVLIVLPAFSLAGCHNPARQIVPQVAHEQLEAEWRKELAPGFKSDRAMAYLLTHRFGCQVTRDDQGRVERIVATQPSAVRDASGAKRNWQIDIAVVEDVIQSVKITPR
jgi:hypothetical protein